MNGLGFLAISNCFYVEEIQSLDYLLNHLSKNKIWGLELQGGGPKSTFGVHFAKLLPTLRTMKSIEHLNISHQFFTPEIIHDVVKAIEAIKVVELIIDEPGLSKLVHFFSFYTRIMAIPSLRSLGRPIQEFENFDMNSVKYEKVTDFKAKICTTSIPSVRRIRVSYYQRYSEMSRFIDFLFKYPASLLDIHFEDKYGVMTQHKNTYAVRSLLDPNLEEADVSLSYQQSKFLLSPYESPNEDESNMSYEIPSLFRCCNDDYTFDESLVDEKEIIQEYNNYITSSKSNTFKEIIKIGDLFKKFNVDKNSSFKSNIQCKKPTYIIPTKYKDIVIKAILEQQQEEEFNPKSEQSFVTQLQSTDFYDESEISESTNIFDIDPQSEIEIGVPSEEGLETSFSNVSISKLLKHGSNLSLRKKRRRKASQTNSTSTTDIESTDNFLSAYS